MPPGGIYDWGSNHLLTNNLVVVAIAYDLSGERRYLDGVLEGIDYLFGRNPLLGGRPAQQCFVDRI